MALQFEQLNRITITEQIVGLYASLHLLYPSYRQPDIAGSDRIVRQQDGFVAHRTRYVLREGEIVLLDGLAVTILRAHIAVISF